MGAFLSPTRAKPAPKSASEILGYFLRNPQACDNLEGVTRWRLPDQRIYETLRTTKKALEWLVGRGFLVKESKPWCGDIYRLNAQRRKKADSFVDGGTEQRGDVEEK